MKSLGPEVPELIILPVYSALPSGKLFNTSNMSKILVIFCSLRQMAIQCILKSAYILKIKSVLDLCLTNGGGGVLTLLTYLLKENYKMYQYS